MHFATPLHLQSGAEIADYTLMYETYGTPERRAQSTRCWSATR